MMGGRAVAVGWRWWGVPEGEARVYVIVVRIAEVGSRRLGYGKVARSEVTVDEVPFVPEGP